MKSGRDHSAWKAIKWAGGILAPALVGGILQAGPVWWTGPTISVDGLDAALPLRASFIIQNKSIVFPLTITSLGCEIINIEPLSKGDVDIIVGRDNTAFVIPPGKPKPMNCKIDLGLRNDITRIKMRVLLGYKHAWPLGGGMASPMLTWTPSHWTVGEPMQ